MKQYNTGLLIGRFQPMHKGHIYLIKKALKEVDKLIIGIGSANIVNDDNPMDFFQRKKLVELMIINESFQEKIIKIISLDDFFNDEKWLQNVISKVGDFDCVIGNNDWTNKILEKAGYSVLRFGFYKRFLFEGIAIRNLIFTKKLWQDRVPDYLVGSIKAYMVFAQFKHLILGGTFDHFHIGHKALIDLAFKYGENVSLGIVKENLLKNKSFSNLIEDYEFRKNNVIQYLEQMKFINRVKIVPINNIYGSALIDKSIDAILVSKETHENAIVINKERINKKMPALKIIVAPNVNDDENRLVSSERIRKGEINCQGVNYFTIFKAKKLLILPDNLRNQLRKPMGKIFKGDDIKKTAIKIIKEINKIKPTMVITVGDVVSNSLVNNGLDPDIRIVDNRSRRMQIRVTCNAKRITCKTIINQSGSINSEAIYEIKKAVDYNLQNHQPQMIIINGEEDLLALPAIILAPLNSVILYGQWNLGVAMVIVNEEIKQKIQLILNIFK